MKTQLESSSTVVMVALANLQPGKFNPRKHFDEKTISELAASISRQGILQPIGIRKVDDTDNYEIIYGERRFKASLEAGLKEIPAIVFQVPDETAQELAVTENLQRKDVSPMEEAFAYRNLMQTGRYDVKSLSERFGKSENYIRTRLNFSSLIPEIAELLDADEITISLASEMCRYSEDIQKNAYEEHFKDSNSYSSWRGLKAQEVRAYLQDAYTDDLQYYMFDKAQCMSCPNNTNNILLFSDGGCGRCANNDCLKEKNVSFIVDKAVNFMKKYPDITLCHYGYGYNKEVVERLMSIGYELETVSYGFIKSPYKPIEPAKTDFATTEEYDEAYRKYEQEMADYKKESDGIEQKIVAGELSRYARIDDRDVHLGYVEIQSQKDDAGSCPKEQSPSLAKLEQRDKRNKEIAEEKTIEDVRKQILDVNLTESKFGTDEDKMVYFFLMSSLRHEHFNVVGLDDSHSRYLSDEEKLNAVSNLSAKAKTVLRRDFLISKFQERYISEIAKSLLLDFAQKHMPEELANIKKTHYDVYEKRHKRIEEKKLLLKSKEAEIRMEADISIQDDSNQDGSVA